MKTEIKNVKEDLSLDVVERMLDEKKRIRLVVGPHPVHGKPSSFIPYLDLAETLTCPPQTIHSIISRSERVKKYVTIFMMKTVTGLKPTLCVSEEGLLHIIMKLQPSRCSDPKVGDRLDEIQDEMIQLLRDVLHGYEERHGTASVQVAKTLCQLISVANKTQDKTYLDILNHQIEALSGVRIEKPQLELAFSGRAGGAA